MSSPNLVRPNKQTVVLILGLVLLGANIGLRSVQVCWVFVDSRFDEPVYEDGCDRYRRDGLVSLPVVLGARSMNPWHGGW